MHVPNADVKLLLNADCSVAATTESVLMSEQN